MQGKVTFRLSYSIKLFFNLKKISNKSKRKKNNKKINISYEKIKSD